MGGFMGGGGGGTYDAFFHDRLSHFPKVARVSPYIATLEQSVFHHHLWLNVCRVTSPNVRAEFLLLAPVALVLSVLGLVEESMAAPISSLVCLLCVSFSPAAIA